MKILEIYKKYNIPPNLQQHMLRVSALADLIYLDLHDPKLASEQVIVTACLLHDLGNILKFDFENYPQYLGEELKNIEHWKAVKQMMVEKYGTDEDTATIQMVDELDVDPKVSFIVENWGFKNFTRAFESDDWNWKLCLYADHRIGPKGVVSLAENIKEKQKRYRLSRPGASHISDQAEDLFNSAVNIEQAVIKVSEMDLEKITTTQVESYIPNLLKISI